MAGTTALTAATFLTALVAEANPEGGAVVGGQATISQAPGHTTIRQQSEKAIINWKGFDIDHNEVTSFIQPGSNSIALNRVDSNKPSLINGRLQANGHVWVVNPSGVVFGPSAQVDVHGIVATTSDILDSDFMNGNYDFSIPAPDPAAAVINQGNISIGELGLAGLVAPHVRNDGMIVGTLGQVVLAGAPTFTLDFQGDGLIQFAATSEVLSTIYPLRALVENPGTIRADGGRVLLTAAVADGVVNEVINTSGVIEARSVSQDRGRIVLHGEGEAIVAVSGRLDATGIDAGTRGGEVDVRGEIVLTFSGARIDASGHSGGGQVLIGGDPQDGGDGDKAKQTIVAPGATIAADATSVGDGGDVLVWADDVLVYAGSISARGGPEGGDGGSVETSSPGFLVTTGTVDTGAVAGEDGQWLLDTLTVRIIDTPDGPPTYGTATVFAQSINQAIGNVVIKAAHTITVEQSIQTAATLQLTVQGTLTLDRPIVTDAEGDAIVLVTDSLINNVGPDALVTPNGRYIIYSVNPKNDVLNGIPATIVYGANIESTPPEVLPDSGNVILYEGPGPTVPPPPPPPPEIPALTINEINVITDPIVISPSDLGQSEAEALAAPAPPQFAVPSALDPAGSQDLLFSNDGNQELWGLSWTQ